MAAPMDRLMRCRNSPVLVLFLLIYQQACNADEPKLSVVTRPLDHIDESLVYFEIIEPKNLHYIYKARPSRNFGTSFNQSYSSAELILANPLHGCSRLINPQQVRGNGVLAVRGQCSFLSKAINAELAGASFIIIMDDDPGSTNTRIDMVDDETGRKCHIPAMFLAGKDGSMIQAQLEHGVLGDYALLNIPVNVTNIPLHRRNHPPWTLI